MRIYLAGPMRGHKWYNFPMFMFHAARLRAYGYDVVNPAELDLAQGIDPYTMPEDFNWESAPPGQFIDDILERDKKAELTCEGIAVFGDWLMSSGAYGEVLCARENGLGISGVEYWIELAKEA